MLDDMRVNDEQLDVSDIRQLESANEIVHFFAKLRYDVDQRTNIPDYAVLGMGSEDMRQHIHKIELIGKDPVDGDISIYLFEVRSVTAKLRNDIARRFRERPENAMLVLTKDYEELEFVMLERVLSRSQSRRAALKQAIRPIPLTLNRRHPDAVALRVLKRFTFTEEDAAYQWEKLRSAYMLAAWSEEYFNNRALFSDHYLKKRLTDPKLTPAWDEDVRPVGREIYKHIITARKNYTGRPADVIRKGLYEPVFKLLGFDFAKPKRGSSSAERAHYLLYTPGDQSQPIAAALTYAWNRNLDNVDSWEPKEDHDSTPFEIPGALVVSLLEAQVAPWVIVTNGKLWRLYSSTANNKATNYYEVDLEEAIAAKDQIIALKYWWLMFRQQACSGFLDTLLKHSADYAKGLGDRLKNRIFVEIFPQFAKGFIADIRAKGISNFDEEALATVFSGTMTFLYRLMFILYAESLELLPVHEVHGYCENSLYRMKHEIEIAGGTVWDESQDKLGKQYKTSSTALYDRLKTLFAVIDQGSDELNMPTYNGGLFSPETDSGKFLATYAIPDRYLALGLDWLTRDVDDRTQALVFIDFKSLGVRHLGSIYEGLLEFKLRIAGEKLAVTKEKGKEVYRPATQVKKPLATLDTGEVYLENDKQERKATGSYYTPDYIVKYIVRHTVGPVLDRKFAALEKRLRDAQRDYRKYARLVEARRKSTGRDESAAVYWSTLEMRNLVDDCLNVRVLDPAMGSGHFLVEVVDYVSNRLIDFLNGWSENPVWAFLEQTRDDILNDMERQRVTIDADRLTRVSLLKRAVLKRCVYGVDLNAMAVELAKVSLWLDAFTLGAPLSFLDHHLKHGNSLIGSRIGKTQDYLRGGEGPVQIDMFSGSEFAGVMLATDLMRQVSYLSDNTVEQIRQSADQFRQANDHLAPFKRLLDVYTSRWFGNGANGTKNTKTDNVRLFLKDAQTKAWIKDPQHTKLDDSLIRASMIAETALISAKARRFFHWELEFPEVFFAPSRPGGQDVQLRKDGGFDAVVGNPPYVRPHNIEEEPKRYYQEVFETFTHKSDLLVCFFEITTFIMQPSGYSGMITSDTWMFLDSFQNLRQMLINHMTVTSLVPFDSKDIFEDASVCPVVITYAHGDIEQKKIFIRIVNKFHAFEISAEIAHELYKNTYKNIFDLSLQGKVPEIKCKIAEQGVPLGEITEVDFGLKTGDDQKFISFKKESNIDKPLIRGDDTYRYYIDFKGEYVHYDTEAMKKHRKTARPGEMGRFEEAKILVKDTSSIGFNCTFDDEYYYAKDMLIVRKKKIANLPFELIAVCGILNSTMMKWYYETTFPTVHVQCQELSTLPIPRIKFTTPAEERERRTREAIGAYDIGDNAGMLQRVQTHIGADETDVVHDLLAHLAQQMIDLHKQKHAEVKRCLTWVEKRLKIQPDKNGVGGIDNLTGKTILQGYLGDYQKGESELPWREFHYRLYQNRNRFAVSLSDVEGEIQREYEKSLETLIPIKRDLARTDALIDKIVYCLYGLTDEEIELIERPQYEQALADAKTQVVADEEIKDDEEKIEKIAAGILPAARRFFERVEPKSDEETLDSELSTWRSLPPEAPTFLLTGDYNLRTLPDHMDFSASIIPYAKAVEVVLSQRIFIPFRQQYTDADCRNDFLKRFMRGEKDLTLGSFMIILSSSQETALRNFISRTIPDATNRVFGTYGLVTVLNDDAMRDIRNKAAHDEVLSRDEAQEARVWAMQVLRQV